MWNKGEVDSIGNLVEYCEDDKNYNDDRHWCCCCQTINNKLGSELTGWMRVVINVKAQTKR